ncbi:MAG: oligosaccharide flippase family protein [bacterium]|nr:oligosaccharide flippase family protein [bacterium]
MVDYNDIRKESTNKRLKFLLKDSVLYGGANAVAKLFAIFTVPILTRLFTREQFGVIDGIGILAAVFTPIMVMGMDSAIARFFYDTEDENERKQVISQGLLVEVVLAVVLCVSLYAGADLLLEWFLNTSRYTHLFRIIIVAVFFSVLVMFSQNLLKWTFSRTRYLVISFGLTTSTVCLTLLYVLVFKLGVAGVFWALLTSNFVFAIIGLVFTAKYIRFPRSFTYLKPMLKFGWPMMFVALIPALVPSIDRWFITNYLSLAILGGYSVGLKIAGLIQLPVLGFQTAWGPFALAIYKEENANETYNKVFLYYTGLLTLASLAIVLLAEPLILIFASAKYRDFIDIVTPLVFAACIDSMCWITGIGITLSKKTIFSTLSYAVTLAAGALFILLLIKPFGLMGVAYGILGSKVVLTVVKTAFAYRIYFIRYRLTTALTICLGGFSAAQLFRFLHVVPWYWQTAGGTVLFALFVFLVWTFAVPGIDKKICRERLARFLKKK